MSKKTEAFTKLYHGNDYQSEEFHYSRIWGLRAFHGTHPRFVKEWIAQNTNEIDILSLPLDISVKDLRVIASDFFEYLTGIRIGEYKNFILIG